ncbi:MAG: hypothetical protein ACRDOM_10640 [Nocardioides sp.]
MLDADDKRAAGLMEAARHSATVPDRRILRVLDVDERADLCFVVNEWGSGTSLDILVGQEGPVGGRRAAWIVSEVAASIAHAHEAGVTHGRLVPENVLIDHTGGVRVIGLSVEAALLGLPAGRVTSDVTDLAALVYYLLTATWPGVSRSACPVAPQDQGRVLRPRQVKAGVPRPLDALCDRVLNSPVAETGTGPNGVVSAASIRDALRDFVGDPSGMVAAEAATSRFAAPAGPVVPPTLPSGDKETGGPGPDVTQDPVVPPPADDATVVAPEVPGPPPTPTDQPPTEQPTQAGLPIFDEDSDEVTWLAARADKPPPPPPFEDPPERPLFAPTPPEGQPARTPRPGAAPPPRDFWPWDTGTGAGSGSGVLPATEDEDDDGEVPGRSWLRLAGAVAAALLLLVAIVFAFNLGRGRSPLGNEPEPESSPSTTPATDARPIEVAGVTDLDPQGDPPEEKPELAPLVVDGDQETSWSTETYFQDFGPAGLKTGVGLVLDLGGNEDVREIDLSLVGEPTDVSLYLTRTAPTGVAGLEAASSTTARAREQITLDEPATGRFLVVWLTSLPPVESGFRGEITEVVVRG